jgi:hypothetical protein
VAGNQGGSESENDDDFDHGWNGLHSFMRNSAPQGITPVRNSPHGAFRVARRRETHCGAGVHSPGVLLFGRFGLLDFAAPLFPLGGGLGLRRVLP